MTTKKKTKRSSTRPRRTAIVPRVVFQTMVAAAVIPVMGGLAGCNQNVGPAADSGHDTYDAPFSVVALRDAGGDAGFGVAADGAFSVVAMPRDAGRDADPDTGFFSVVAIPDDGGFSVLVAPHDSGSSAS